MITSFEKIPKAPGKIKITFSEKFHGGFKRDRIIKEFQFVVEVLWNKEIYSHVVEL